MKKEYPKMIYKGGRVSTNEENYAVVNNYGHHMIQLEIWGDKRPDDIAKVKKIDKTNKKEVKADSVEKSEVKPRRKTTKKV